MTRPEQKILRELLDKELRSGALELVADTSAVALITPAFVTQEEERKPRLVHDLRPLNALLTETHLKYEKVREALSLRGANVGTKIDLASAFKHVRLSAEAANMMCFGVGADGAVFRWTRLPFGMRHSPALFQAALDPTIRRLRARGLRLVVYVDDILIAAEDPENLDDATTTTIDHLDRDGWRIAPEKILPWAHDRLPFLGLRVDFDVRELRVTTSKAAKLERLAKAALGRPRATLHSLQKITGLLAFFLQAEPTVGLAWRYMLGAETEAEKMPGRTVWVKGGLLAELSFWVGAARDLPTWPRLTENRGADISLVTDASADGAGAIWWKNTASAPDLAQWHAGQTISQSGGICRAYDLGDFAAESSTTRELIALLRVLEDWEAHGLGQTSAEQDQISADLIQIETGQTSAEQDQISAILIRIENAVIWWYSDSACAVAAVNNWRSGSFRVTETLTRIWRLALKRGLSIQAAWIARELGFLPAADYLSRVIGRRKQAEWSCPPAVWKAACERLRVHPEVDLFATRTNAKTLRFRSRFPEPGSEGDAFGEPWTGQAWAFPPFALLDKVVRQWESARGGCRLLLLAPADHHQVLAADRAGLIRAKMRWPAHERLLDQAGRPAPDPPKKTLRFFVLDNRR